jgi:hypothetical protein
MRAGEVWQVHHNRKGRFTIKLTENVDLGRDDEWVEAEVVEGEPSFLSQENSLLNPEAPEKITMRASLLVFEKRISE